MKRYCRSDLLSFQNINHSLSSKLCHLLISLNIHSSASCPRKRNKKRPFRGGKRHNSANVLDDNCFHHSLIDKTTNTKLKIGLLNAQACGTKSSEIHDCIIENDLDILCLTET